MNAARMLVTVAACAAALGVSGCSGDEAPGPMLVHVPKPTPTYEGFTYTPTPQPRPEPTPVETTVLPPASERAIPDAAATPRGADVALEPLNADPGIVDYRTGIYGNRDSAAARQDGPRPAGVDPQALYLCQAAYADQPELLLACIGRSITTG